MTKIVRKLAGGLEMTEFRPKNPKIPKTTKRLKNPKKFKKPKNRKIAEKRPQKWFGPQGTTHRS